MSRINPLKVLITKASSLNDRLANWSILLSCYDIRYTLAKAIKGQALVEFLAEHPLLKNSEFKDDLLDEQIFFTEKIITHTVDPNLHWIMHLDGATQTNEFGETVLGVGIIFYSLERVYIPHSFPLLELCSNNAAKYTALITRLELAMESGIDILAVYGDSQLIIKQMNPSKKAKLGPLLQQSSKA